MGPSHFNTFEHEVYGTLSNHSVHRCWPILSVGFSCRLDCPYSQHFVLVGGNLNCMEENFRSKTYFKEFVNFRVHRHATERANVFVLVQITPVNVLGGELEALCIQCSDRRRVWLQNRTHRDLQHLRIQQCLHRKSAMLTTRFAHGPRTYNHSRAICLPYTQDFVRQGW